MTQIFPSTRTRSLLIAIPLGAILAFLGGWYVGIQGFSYREVIILGMVAASFLIVASNDRALRVGLFIAIMAFGLGYRTVEVTAHLRLHPSELLVWSLLVLLLFQQQKKRQPLNAWLPGWLLILIPFWLWAWIPGLYSGLSWDLMLAEFRNFLVIVPLFVVTQFVLRDKLGWSKVLLIFFVTGAWIAVMGILEFALPAFAQVMPEFITAPGAALEIGGFQRARFSFWGAPSASFILVLAAPLALSLWHWVPRPSIRILLILALILQVFGAFIAGYRSIWLILIVQFLVAMFFTNGVFGGSLAALGLAAAYRFLSGSVLFRFNSLLLALEGIPVDSSAVERSSRSSQALQAAIEKPWGLGWGGSGWTHSDVVQVAANQGLLAGALFIGAYLFTLYRLWRVVRTKYRDVRLKATSRALFLSFIAAGGLLLSQGVQVLPQTILPVWFTWVLAELWIHRMGNLRERLV